MTEKYKILGKYIKDMSSETPDVENLKTKKRVRKNLILRLIILQLLK